MFQSYWNMCLYWGGSCKWQFRQLSVKNWEWKLGPDSLCQPVSDLANSLAAYLKHRTIWEKASRQQSFTFLVSREESC